MSGPSFDPDTLERLVPQHLTDDDVSRATLALHLERYGFAARHCMQGRVLDIACGVGYGSAAIAEHRSDVEVTGVDVSPAAVAFAREHYASDRVTFEAGDALEFGAPAPFDTVVSLETIEHLPDPGRFIERVASLVRPGGRFIASVPTTPSVDANPHHLHDFTTRSFRRLVGAYGFEDVAALPQSQPFGVRSVLTRTDSRTKNVRQNLPAYYARHPGSFVRRVASTLRYGFVNRYITIAWEKLPSAVASSP